MNIIQAIEQEKLSKNTQEKHRALLPVRFPSLDLHVRSNLPRMLDRSDFNLAHSSHQCLTEGIIHRMN